MEIHGNPWIPWKSLDSMEIHGIHGNLWNPWKSMESMEIHGNAWISMEIQGIIHGNPWIPWKSVDSMDGIHGNPADGENEPVFVSSACEASPRDQGLRDGIRAAYTCYAGTGP